MKKSAKKGILFFVAVMFLCIAIVLSSCSSQSGEETSHKHSMETVAAVEATCIEDGNIAYYRCTECGKNFSDRQGENELSDSEIVIEATGIHTSSDEYSYDEEYHWYECTVCGGVYEKETHSFDSNGVCTTCGITLISTEAELKAISMDGSYLLTVDIDLGGTEWTPLGTTGSPFKGTFDGGNHIISNYKITSSSQETAYLGLFGYCSSGEIKNLTIKDFTVTLDISASDTTAEKIYYIGGLAGYGYYMTMSNCNAYGNIVSTGSFWQGTDIYMGGLVGYAKYKTTGNNCYADINMEVTLSASSSTIRSYIGSACGYIDESSINNSHTSGDIVLVSSAQAMYSYVGGLAGYLNKSTIDGCYAISDVTATAKSSSTKTSAYAGGYVGGICGYSYNTKISETYSAGNITGTVTTYQYGEGNVGGISGYFDATSKNYAISNAFSSGEVSSYMSVSYVETSNYLNVKAGQTYVGGLVGQLIGGSVLTSFATGNTTATATKAAAYAGGLVGYYLNAEIAYGFATGDVTAIVDNSTTNTYAIAGGICGNNEGSLSTLYRSSEQTVTGGTIGLAGTEIQPSQLLSSSFLTGTVGFSSEIWNITDGSYPVQIIHEDSYTFDGSESGDSTEENDDSETVGSDGLEYTLVSDHYIVSGIGTCSDQAIVIPSTYNNMPVTAIADNAFYGNSTMTSIIIPASITSIGAGAFDSCSKIESVALTSGLVSMGKAAFSGCVCLTSIVLPDTLNGISNDAFLGCVKLTSVTLSSGTTSIGESAFEDCVNLSSVVIPASVTVIGINAFYGCSSLLSVTFSNTDNWYLADYSTATSGTSIDVTSADQNAINLKNDEYSMYYWLRKTA